MRTKFNPKGFPEAEKRLGSLGVRIQRGSAAEMQQVAQREARVGKTGNMRRGIELVPTSDGAYVIATDPKTIWHEYGTGDHAGDKDSEFPDQRASTGSEAKVIPWVYFSDEYGWVTTSGVKPKPMMRPGFNAGVEHFHKEKKRYGL